MNHILTDSWFSFDSNSETDWDIRFIYNNINCFSNSQKIKKGVYFYEDKVNIYSLHLHKKINPESDLYQGVKSYQFNLAFIPKITKEDLENNSLSYSLFSKFSNEREMRDSIELVSFVATLDLKDLPYKTNKYTLNNKEYTNSIILWDEFFKTVNPKLYEFHLDRFNKKQNKKIISAYLTENKEENLECNVNEFEISASELLSNIDNKSTLDNSNINSSTTNSSNNYVSKFNVEEFLEFNETAECWGGPHEMENKLGCYLTFQKRDIYDLSFARDSINIDPVQYNWSHIDLPNIYKQEETLNKIILDCTSTKLKQTYFELKKYVSGCILNEEQKANIFNSLPLSLRHVIFKNYLERNIYIEETKPYFIYLYGTDDISYTKYFYTQKEAEKEIQYLRKLQPLDFYLDIIDRNYIFSN